MTDPVTLDGEGPIGEFDEKRAENAVRELLHRGRRGPGPRGPPGDAGAGGAGVQGDIRRAAAGARRTC